MSTRISTATALLADHQSTATPAHHLALEHVSKAFHAGGNVVHAVSDMSLSVRPAEFVSLLGPSGCGKSTLLRIAAGLVAPTSGEVFVGGGSPQAAQRTKRLGMVFQQAALMPWRTVTDNVALPLEVNRRSGHAVDKARRIADLLDQVGLADFARAYPHQLSGGMQQRVAIARALVFDPDILLMDEPFGALDEITRDQMRYELLRIWGTHRKTVLFVTHSIPEAIVLSDRVVVMSARPGMVREILTVDLPRPRDERLESSASFLSLAEHLKGLLRPGSSAPTG